MRKKLNITDGIFPMPVLMVATYNDDGSINVMNAAWGTMQERSIIVLNLTETHKTVKNIKARGAFTVSMLLMYLKPTTLVLHPVIRFLISWRRPVLPQARRKLLTLLL